MTELIGVDWGSSNLRVMRLDAGGEILEHRLDPRGAAGLTPEDFAQVLADVAGGWLRQAPVLICGMAGAREGWTEAPYVYCPADARTLAGRLVPAPGMRRVWLVPGVALTENGLGDVMRGEETQAVGALGDGENGLVIAPGTHSKWVEVLEGAIVSFRTHMTGDLFAAVKGATAVGRGMGAPGLHRQAFEAGVREGLDRANLTSALFGIRVRRLAERMTPDEAADHLSGLLIGAEIAAEDGRRGRPVVLIGEPGITDRYGLALRMAGFGRVRSAVGDAAVAKGLWRLWSRSHDVV